MENKPKVFFLCSGLGRINRGYESFTQESYDALKDNPNFDSYLIKGGGPQTQKSYTIYNFSRSSKIAIFLSKLLNKEAYTIEQFTFCIFLLPLLFKKKPTVIYYSDFITGTYLWHYRRLLKFKYKLLFCNGSPNGPPFAMDHVQQLLPRYYNEAASQGVPQSKMTLLPLGFEIDINDRLNNNIKIAELRKDLGFSEDQKIILSVGAVNKHHKRMHYVINEVAKLPPNYFLVILGQFEKETPPLLEMANQKLQGRHLITSVPLEKVKDYYVTADYFVLASLIEGFGRVLIEAMSYGLPSIVNDYLNSRQVLGQYGTYIDMEKEGALANCISNDENQFKKAELINAAYNIYSWDKLKAPYSDMITQLFN